jgi:Chaperone of endosialidase
MATKSDFIVKAGLTVSNSLTVATNTATIGTSAYFVANGNVGIGTSSPIGKLDVKTATDSKLVVHDGNTANNVRLSAVNLAFNAYKDLEINSLSAQFWTAGNERMRIDSSGNVGIGRTPSSWTTGGGGALQGYSFGISATAGFDTTSIVTNAYQTNNSGTTWNYVGTATATRYDQYGGTHRFLYAASGTAGAAITWTEAMRIDSSGNVGIGTATPAAKLEVAGARVRITNATDPGVEISNATAVKGYMFWDASGADVVTLRHASNTLGISITNTGIVGIGTTGPKSYSKLHVASNTHPIIMAEDIGTGVGYFGQNGQQTIIGAEGYTSFKYGVTFANGAVTTGTESVRIDTSGNLLIGTTSLPIATTRVGISGASGVSVGLISFVNTSASTKKWSTGPDGNGNYIVYNDASAGMYMAYSGTSWTSSSDERFKTDLIPIENATSKVSSLRAVTGRFKTDEEGKSRSFLIAQDVLAVLPEAVDVSDPDKLGVQYTDVIPLLVAAIQELSAEVTALKAKLA